MTWLIAVIGWRGAFIVTGLIGLVWALAWWFIYRDPERYRAVAPAEVDALLAERAAPVAAAQIPWSSLFRYRSIWGLMIGMFCLNFAIYFFITWFPSYLQEARGFSLARAGHPGDAARPDGHRRQLGGRLSLGLAAQAAAGAGQRRARPAWWAGC